MKASLRRTMQWKHTHRGRPSYRWVGGNQDCKYWKCKKCGAYKSWISQEYANRIRYRVWEKKRRKLVDDVFSTSPLLELLKKKNSIELPPIDRTTCKWWRTKTFTGKVDWSLRKTKRLFNKCR